MREARHRLRCAVCRESGDALGERVRALPSPALTRAESAALWRAILAGIAGRPAWRAPGLVAWLRGFGRRRPMLAPAVAAAAAILLVLAPLHIGREDRILSQAALNAQTVIEGVEAGPSASVLVLDAPENLSIIWVMEPSADD